MYFEDVKDYFDLQHALIYTVFDGMVEKALSLSFSKLFLDWKSIEY